jgi:hypothetical protein
VPANLSILLNATLSATDVTLSPSATMYIRNLNNPTLAGTVAFADMFFQAAASPGSVVCLPAVTCWVLYVKNLDSAANLTVSWNAIGSAGVSTFILVPGGVFLYMQPTEGAGGFQAPLTLISSAGTINTEVFVAK